MSRHPQRIEPAAGQESVWDYPRPPRLEPVKDRVRVELRGRTIADTTSAYRVLETSHPPVYYVPRADIDGSVLTPAVGSSVCEYKGVARYLDVDGVPAAAWCYPSPSQGYGPMADHVAFYPAKMDVCWVGDEQVQAQEGDFYGGWVTSDVVGPFKGAPGTWGW
jgi:uncharacterized protein (DUF427 family)